MRFLALDPGSQRVGVAISDPDGRIAVPLTTIDVGGDPGAAPDAGRRGPDDTRLRVLAAQIGDIVADHEIGTIVLGLPVREDGTEGPEARRVRRLGRHLERSLETTITFYDERFTSRIVENAAREVGAGGARRAKRARVRGKTDRMAATLILQGYLDRQLSSGADPAQPSDRR